MDGLYNEIMLIKRIKNRSLQGYALLTIENRKDRLLIPELRASCSSLISSHINYDKAIQFGVPSLSGL